MKNNKGFSLVELIVVIAIMAILAAVAIPTFATFITKANEAADEDFANGVEYAVELALAAENVELDSIEVVMDTTTKKISSLTYKLEGDETNYVAYGTVADATAAETDIANLISGTIDKEYKLKSNQNTLTFETNVVTITVE